METRTQTARLIVLALLMGAAVALWRMPSPLFVADPSLLTALPETVGSFRGEPLLFCQNDSCLRSCEYRLALDARCPYCGGPLETKSPAEKRQLPADTIVSRRRYRDADGHTIIAALVFSGQSRTSIHRPQMCLSTQGYVIERQRRVTPDDNASDAWQVTWLDIRLPGIAEQRRAAFAYWFIGHDRETPYYLQQLAWIVADNLFRNRVVRWASASALLETAEDDTPDTVLKSFLTDLHTALRTGASPAH